MAHSVLVEPVLSKAELEATLGRRPSTTLDNVWRGPCRLVREDGSLVAELVTDAVSPEAVQAALPFLLWAGRQLSDDRGHFSGRDRIRRIKADGTVSNTNRSRQMRSTTAGSLNRSPRLPWCRRSTPSRERAEDWQACFPLLREVADTLRRHVPKRYAAQAAIAAKTHPAWVIPGTPFTTVTINLSESGACHRDGGDYKPGFGAMLVLRRGLYDGCELVFPKYGAGFDPPDRSVVLFDPHEVHGNLPFRSTNGTMGDDWWRISVPCYFRTKMCQCRSPSVEVRRAQRAAGQ